MPPDIAHSDFANTNVQGDFGETLTDVILTRKGGSKCRLQVRQRRPRHRRSLRARGARGRRLRGSGRRKQKRTKPHTTDVHVGRKAGAGPERTLRPGRVRQDAQRSHGEGIDPRAAQRPALLPQGTVASQPLERHDRDHDLGRNGEKKPLGHDALARTPDGRALSVARSNFDRRSVYLGRPPVDDEATPNAPR